MKSTVSDLRAKAEAGQHCCPVFRFGRLDRRGQPDPPGNATAESDTPHRSYTLGIRLKSILSLAACRTSQPVNRARLAGAQLAEANYPDEKTDWTDADALKAIDAARLK